MRSAPLVALQVVVAVLVGLGVWVVWDARQSSEAPTEQSTDTIAVSASIRPSVHTFGDPIVATVEVVADPRLVKPQTIRVDTDFAPYEPAGPPTVERTTANGITHVVFHYPLRCLTEGCDVAEDRGEAQFDAGFVRYRFVQGSGPGRDLIDWPPIQVASRVTDTEVSDVRWRASSTALPSVTTRFGPVGLSVALVLIAVGLTGAAVWLGMRLWRVEREPEAEPVDLRSPLERAVDLVRAASSNGVTHSERRMLLERLARELQSSGHASLADDARELAWSPRSSTSAELEVLVRRATEVAANGSAG
jgi:cytoskeletal protein RodZ